MLRENIRLTHTTQMTHMTHMTYMTWWHYQLIDKLRELMSYVCLLQSGRRPQGHTGRVRDRSEQVSAVRGLWSHEDAGHVQVTSQMVLVSTSRKPHAAQGKQPSIWRMKGNWTKMFISIWIPKSVSTRPTYNKFYKFLESVKFTARLVMIDSGILFVYEIFLWNILLVIQSDAAKDNNGRHQKNSNWGIYRSSNLWERGGSSIKGTALDSSRPKGESMYRNFIVFCTTSLRGRTRTRAQMLLAKSGS